MSQNPPASNASYLIVGLGNPGPKYARTRHNAGFMVVDELARRHGLRFSTRQANAEIARGSIDGQAVILAKPQTYMNNSGQAVGDLQRFYKLPLEHVIVVCDDIALPLGTIRLREKGSAGGHNGLTSVIQHLGTQNFPRLRVGVDQPLNPDHSRIDWVLGRFTKDEEKVISEVVPRAADAIEAIFDMGLEKAMNAFNARADDQPLTTDDRPPTTSDGELKTDQSDGWVGRLRRIIAGEGKSQ
jgi:PTH1 family peptidyl-tRNA hydrolase